MKNFYITITEDNKMLIPVPHSNTEYLLVLDKDNNGIMRNYISV